MALYHTYESQVIRPQAEKSRIGIQRSLTCQQESTIYYWVIRQNCFILWKTNFDQNTNIKFDVRAGYNKIIRKQ